MLHTYTNNIISNIISLLCFIFNNNFPFIFSTSGQNSCQVCGFLPRGDFPTQKLQEDGGSFAWSVKA